MLMSALGLGSCDEVNEIINRDMMLAYGSPHVNYSVKGKVTDESGKAIEGIRVKVEARHHSDGYVYYRMIEDYVKTDAKGAWTRGSAHYPTDTLQVTFEDIDGDANGGQFASDSIRVPVKVVKDEKNTSAWYMGDAKVDVPTVKLKKQ